jgi:thiamine biosynthesis lipoprotein
MVLSIMRFQLLLLAFVSCILAASCSPTQISTSETRISLGTYVQITVVSSEDTKRKVLADIDAAYERIESLDTRFDYRTRNTALWMFNHSTSIMKSDDSELFSLLIRALELAELTDGYFDPTVLPLVELWGFDKEDPRLPTEEEINEALQKVGFRNVRILEDRIEKPLWVQFDLSAIAKGEIVDIIRDFMRERGYDNFLINAGGDIYVGGLTEEKKKWRIAIQDPIRENRYSGIAEKSNLAIVTSGDYERFFMEGGVRYSHLFNPKTGYPFSDLKSVTIIADETAFADAVATGVFSMGSERGYDFLIRNGIEGFMIYGVDGNRVQSRHTPRFWN